MSSQSSPSPPDAGVGAPSSDSSDDDGARFSTRRRFAAGFFGALAHA